MRIVDIYLRARKPLGNDMLIPTLKTKMLSFSNHLQQMQSSSLFPRTRSIKITATAPRPQSSQVPPMSAEAAEIVDTAHLNLSMRQDSVIENPEAARQISVLQQSVEDQNLLIKSLQQQLQTAKNDQKDLREQSIINSRLQDDSQHLQNEVQELQTQIEQLKVKNNMLVNENQMLAKENNNLQQKLTQERMLKLEQIQPAVKCEAIQVEAPINVILQLEQTVERLKNEADTQTKLQQTTREKLEETARQQLD